MINYILDNNKLKNKDIIIEKEFSLTLEKNSFSVDIEISNMKEIARYEYNNIM